MNKTTLSRLSLALFSGAFFWSSWLQTARIALSSRLPYREVGAASSKDASARQRFELSQKLERARSEKLGRGDAKAVKKAWGDDSQLMLDILRRSGR